MFKQLLRRWLPLVQLLAFYEYSRFASNAAITRKILGLALKVPPRVGHRFGLAHRSSTSQLRARLLERVDLAAQRAFVAVIPLVFFDA